MNSPIIVANWKMNPQSFAKAKDIAMAEDYENAIICPPFVFLSEIKKLLKKAKLGGQNAFYEKEGPFTGEISLSMLKDSGCEYVIIGHSERRTIFNESNNQVNKKIKEALSLDIIPIICVSEPEEFHSDEEKSTEYIEKQLQQSLQDISTTNFIIAYEPIFAIGTGASCDIDLAQKRKNIIQNIMYNIYKKEIPIFYGGSVEEQNATYYINNAGFSGLLIGGASLSPEKFTKICNLKK